MVCCKNILFRFEKEEKKQWMEIFENGTVVPVLHEHTFSFFYHFDFSIDTGLDPSIAILLTSHPPANTHIVDCHLLFLLHR